MIRKAISLSLCMINFAFATQQPPKLQAPLFNNLGTFHFPITTKSPLAQRFFDQGFVLYYGFEWGEAIRSFKEAARLDPDCAMCFWGLALALGSKINAPIVGNEYKDAKTAIDKAQALQTKVTPKEQAYIKALALRFQHAPKPVKQQAATFNCHMALTLFDTSSKGEIAAYAQAMKNLSTAYPEDNDAKALYAYAMFDSIEWNFWDANGKINKVTPALIENLNAILARNKKHIGANHYYIHVLETSPNPGTAMASADLLKTLVPGSEHLVHMPTHIYFLTGKYHEGTQSNLQAIEVFKQYIQYCRNQGFAPEINYLYLHNYDFLRTTATMEGRRGLALQAARQMLDEPFSTWLANEPSLQWFIPIPYYVKARFGLWSMLLAEKQPDAKYPYALGMWHYARGLALLHTGALADAEKELSVLNALISKGPSNNILGKGGMHLLEIASAVLSANIADAHGDKKNMFKQLMMAKQIQHDMGYHEPPDWYFSLDQALGDAYLKWKLPQEAIIAYKKALEKYPDNPWALYGLSNALKAINVNDEALRVYKAFKQAWQYADIPKPIALF